MLEINGFDNTSLSFYHEEIIKIREKSLHRE
jgi:hypothetical protein